jgi:hypothetical protein
MYIRASGTWTGEWAIQQAEQLFGEERAKSFALRVHSENLLAEKAMERPWFGWGRWNRNRVIDDRGRDRAPTDGLWIIMLGQGGIVGLAALTLVILLPTLLVWKRCPLRLWSHPGVAATAAIAVLLVLHMIDNLLNAMLDPVFILALGSLAGVQPCIRAQMRQIAGRPRGRSWMQAPSSPPQRVEGPVAARAPSELVFPR